MLRRTNKGIHDPGALKNFSNSDELCIKCIVDFRSCEISWNHISVAPRCHVWRRRAARQYLAELNILRLNICTIPMAAWVRDFSLSRVIYKTCRDSTTREHLAYSRELFAAKHTGVQACSSRFCSGMNWGSSFPGYTRWDEQRAWQTERNAEERKAASWNLSGEKETTAPEHYIRLPKRIKWQSQTLSLFLPFRQADATISNRLHEQTLMDDYNTFIRNYCYILQYNYEY